MPLCAAAGIEPVRLNALSLPMDKSRGFPRDLVNGTWRRPWAAPRRASSVTMSCILLEVMVSPSASWVICSRTMGGKSRTAICATAAACSWA